MTLQGRRKTLESPLGSGSSSVGLVVSEMTCYFRHITRLLEEIGVEVTKENKRDIDRQIHELLGVDYKDCSTTWKAVKQRIAEDEQGFVSSIKKTLSA